jgi:hypothetical protein
MQSTGKEDNYDLCLYIWFLNKINNKKIKFNSLILKLD